MNLADRLLEQPFQGYAYSYPHKTAYRPFAPALPLAPLWEAEDRTALFLYVHLPFCEMRCGFCNLFTTTDSGGGQVDAYLGALERQMATLGPMLRPHRFARVAFGGGTPTFLSAEEIARLFAMIDRRLGGLETGIPISFEMSPGTVTEEKIRVLRAHEVTRASLGVQSFVPEENKALGRPQNAGEVAVALDALKSAGFDIVNVDLIYGMENQTQATWQRSLDAAVSRLPEEIYLYPLYVRPLTGLGRRDREPSDLRLACYRQGRDFLQAHGYRQISMRLFRLETAPGVDCSTGPVYCCQEDGMVGFGAGARSYTDAAHYSTEYAVGRSGIRAILDAFVRRKSEDFAQADYGCQLDESERRRRCVIKSLLRREGLDLTRYRARFGSDPAEDFPALRELIDHALALDEGGHFRLTVQGMERSDTIGPWLFSDGMQQRMEEYELA